MKKETLLTTAVLVLIALNITLLVVFYINQGREPFMPPGQMGNMPTGTGTGPGRFMIERLKFDDAQQNEFAKLRQQHQDKVQAIQQESRKLQDELFDLLKEPQQDPAKVSAIINSMGDNRKQLEQAIFDHFSSIKALCKTDEQKKLFNDFIDQLGETIGPPMQHRGRGGPPWMQGPPPER